MNETIYAEDHKFLLQAWLSKTSVSIISTESSKNSTLVKYFWKKEMITIKISHKKFTFYESTNNIEI